MTTSAPALSIPREPTRVYVGRPTVPALDESPSIGRYLGYSTEDVLAAAERGKQDGDDLGAALVETICTAYVSLVQDDNTREQELATLRAQLATEQRSHAETLRNLTTIESMLLAEMRERNRLAGLHAALSAALARVTHDAVIVEVPL